MQEPLSGFLIVWSRFVEECSGSHMAQSGAINAWLNGLMLSLTPIFNQTSPENVQHTTIDPHFECM